MYPGGPMSNGDNKADEEKPPPIPVKKRKQQQYLQSHMSYTGGLSPHTSPTHHCYHQHSLVIRLLELGSDIYYRHSLPVSSNVIPPVLLVSKL